MVSILPGARTPWDLIGASIGQNISENFPGAVQQGLNRGQLQQSLSSLKGLSEDKNASPLDLSLGAIQALAGIPGSERYAAAIIPKLVEFAEARRAGGVPLPGEGNQPRGMAEAGAPSIPQSGQQGQGVQGSNFFPTNTGPQQPPGNLPQAATTGQVLPLLTPREIPAAARKLAEDYTAAGIPMKPADAIPLIQQQEEQKRLHNETVETERQQRIAGQKNYGQKAVEQLKEVYPNASPEMEAIFQKKGEDEAAKGKSEAEINRYLALEAKKFANSIANVDKDLSAPRLLNSIGRSLNGTYKDFQKAGADVRKHLQPILDLGLYDTARQLLEDKGYGVEEREMIINPLSERSNVALNKIPKIKRIKPLRREGPINLDDIQEGLKDLKKIDPNFSLPLARKAFEDKGYDWRSFKDALNDLENQGFELSDDQKIQRGYLDSPPLNDLEKFLYGLGFIGR